MKTKSFELLWALLLILFFAAGYYFFVRQFDAIPAAQSIPGHSLGLLGSVMVLMTETLYSLRKRSQMARWGRMSNWLQFHIITGLVGPFLILLHSSWKYNGLAGIVTFMMVVVVISGFIGRYIYTTIPRTADGIALAEWELEEKIQSLEREIESWMTAHADIAAMINSAVQDPPSISASDAQVVLGSASIHLAERKKWRQIERRTGPEISTQFKQIRKIVQRRNTLERQRSSLAFSRRLFSIWHSLHVPVALALFAAAAVHMAAALYYATLLR